MPVKAMSLVGLDVHARQTHDVGGGAHLTASRLGSREIRRRLLRGPGRPRVTCCRYGSL